MQKSKVIAALTAGILAALVYFMISEQTIKTIGKVSDYGDYYVIWGSGPGSADGFEAYIDTAKSEKVFIYYEVKPYIFFLNQDIDTLGINSVTVPFEWPEFAITVGQDTVLRKQLTDLSWEWDTILYDNKGIIRFSFLNDQWIPDTLDVNLKAKFKVFAVQQPHYIFFRPDSNKIKIIWESVGEDSITYRVRLWNDSVNYYYETRDTFFILPDSILSELNLFYFTYIQAIDSVGNISAPSETLFMKLKIQVSDTCDLNGDGFVNKNDYTYFKSRFALSIDDSLYDSRCDLNGDGWIDGFDLYLLARKCSIIMR